MRVSKIVLAALCLLPVAPRLAHAAACNGDGVPEALALVQEQCCPARNHGAFVSCATHVLKPLVKAGQLQASCKHVIFKAGCPATTTTTTPPESTTTTAPSETTTTTAPEETTTTSMATTSSTTSSTTPESTTTTTHHRHTTTTVEETTTTTTAAASTTTTSEAATTTTSSAPPSSTTSTSGPVETTTTSPASTTTSTTGGQPTTTSSTAPGATSTTTSTPGATSTTTTTLGGEPGPREICGNCIDDDGNGLTDFEDPACCMQTQSFTMDVTRGLLRPHGGTTRLKLKSILAEAGLADVNPLAQDVFVQIRPVGSTDVLCAKAPADKFMKMHGAFKFWDRHHLVASAKGINDILVKVRKDGSVRFSAVGKRVEFATPPAGTLQVTVGFRNPATAESGNRCSTQTQAFRTGRQGRLLAP